MLCAPTGSESRSTTCRPTGTPSSRTSGYQRGQFPVAEKFYSEEISLPMFVGLTDSDLDRVIEAVHRAVQG